MSTSTEQWASRLCMEDGDFYSHERLVCVPEARDVRIELVPWMDR